MDTLTLVSRLQDIALFLELTGANPFKVRAFQNGARILERLSPEDFKTRIEEGTLREIKGIGPGLLEKINEFAETGVITEYETLRNKIPAGVIELLKVPGLGPKKALVLHSELQINSVGELEYACRENRLVHLKGFGEKTQSKILKSIEFMKRYQSQHLLSDTLFEGQILKSFVENIKGVGEVHFLGPLRRRCEIVDAISVLVVAQGDLSTNEKFERLAQKVLEYPGFSTEMKERIGTSTRRVDGELKNGIGVRLYFCGSQEAAHRLVWFTGNERHLRDLSQKAQSLGMTFSERGLEKNGKLQACEGEEEIYEKLGLSWISPELREGDGEVEAAGRRSLPQLVDVKEVKGVFHCHTSESDGNNTLEEMVSAAQALGFEYIGISDHSASSAGYANGLKVDRVLDQFERIEALQKKFKIKIFKGIESDILSDGSLDYKDEILKKFDFVIGSIHSGFTQSRDQMTARVLKALANPYLDFLGHPTGRLLLAREGFQIDMKAVIEHACRVGVIIELNSHPQRLDMDWRLGKFLLAQKGRVSINPDAHSVAGLEDIEYGVAMARKAWLSSEEIVNTRSESKILSCLRRARERGRGL